MRITAGSTLTTPLHSCWINCATSGLGIDDQVCADIAAMIAYAGCKRLMAGETQGLGVSVKARWPLNQI